MNLYEYVKSRGRCKVACGWEVLYCSTHEMSDQDYPIFGIVVLPSGHHSLYKWSKDGKIENPEQNHGLDLVPIVPVVSYRVLAKEDLAKMKDISETIGFFSDKG